MLEVIFILVTVFIAYMAVSVAADKQVKKTDLKSKVEATLLEDKKESKDAVKEPVKQVVKKEKLTSKRAKPPKSTVMPTGQLRNPETGNVDNIATSYRMLKRWIKDALVKEGLLEKIYKTKELNAAVNKKIAKAVDKLKKIDGYQ